MTHTINKSKMEKYLEGKYDSETINVAQVILDCLEEMPEKEDCLCGKGNPDKATDLNVMEPAVHSPQGCSYVGKDTKSEKEEERCTCTDPRQSCSNCPDDKDKDWRIRIELCLRTLAGKLKDTEENFGINESYRLALGEVSMSLLGTSALEEKEDYTCPRCGEVNTKDCCPVPQEKAEDQCQHCGGPKAIRNPKGFCDHLYYPDNCKECAAPQVPTRTTATLNPNICGEQQYSKYGMSYCNNVKPCRKHKKPERWKPEKGETYSGYGNCPKCGISWDGGEIPKEHHEYYSAPYRYAKIIGVEIPEKYDGVDHYMCPGCKAEFKREEITFSL